MPRTGRRVDEADSDFERGTLRALYNTPLQQRRRRLLRTALLLKHGLRGLLFSWPLYIPGLGAWWVPGPYSGLLILLMLPGIWVSSRILRSGYAEEVGELLEGVVLKPDALKIALWPTSH